MICLQKMYSTLSVLRAPFKIVVVSRIVFLYEMKSVRPHKMTYVRNPKDSAALPRVVVKILKGHC